MSAIQGKVIRKLSPTELVVNIGRSHGISESSRFIVFALGDEIKDPYTGELLGPLEIVRGRAEAKHVQDKMSTIRSVEKRRVTRDRERPVPSGTFAKSHQFFSRSACFLGHPALH